jgi:hypothetical protein
MRLPPEVESDGLRAYEEARAFENLRRKRLPTIYAGLTLLMILAGSVMWRIGHPDIAGIGLVTAFLFAVLARFTWQNLSIRYEKNLHLLAELEGRYGEEVPWLQVERHLAALDQLQADLAEEKRAREGG